MYFQEMLNFLALKSKDYRLFMTQELIRKSNAEINKEAHQAAWASASLFEKQHKFLQGRVNGDDTSFVVHGYHDANQNFIPISKLTTGVRPSAARLVSMRPIAVVEIEKLLKINFTEWKAWECEGRQIKIKDFFKPILIFLKENAEHLNVLTNEHLDNYRYLKVYDVLEFFITLKDVEGKERFWWRITITNSDLVTASDLLLKEKIQN